MVTPTKIKTRTRTRTAALNPRWTTSSRRSASPLCEPTPPATPESDRTEAPTTQPAVERQSTRHASAPVERRSLLGRFSMWVRHYPGAESAPSQHALDTIADVAYFRHR